MLKINPSLLKHNVSGGIDMNELLRMIHAEGCTGVGLICVRRTLTPGKGQEVFIQWLNTPENLQAIILDGLARMQKENLISKSILSL